MNKPFLFLLLLLSLHASAEELVYEMSVFGFTFGKMVVTKNKIDDSTEVYTLNAKGKTNFLWMKREDETRYEVRYRNGKLLSSTYIQIESGVIKHWTNITFDGTKYLVDSYRGKRTFTEIPDYSVLTLYFKQPVKRTQVFYEAESHFIDLKYKEDNVVEMKADDGSRTVYYFTNGKLNEIEIHLSIANVHMNRIN